MGDRPGPPDDDELSDDAIYRDGGADDDVILQDEPDDEPPSAAMPSPWLFRGSLLTVALGTAVAVFLIASPPESEGRAAPTRTLATATTAPSIPTATATPPGATPSVTIPAPSPTPDLTSTPTAGAERSHVVESGDTLFAIAEQYGTSVEAILALNPGLTADSINIGDTIRIPAASE